MIQKKYGEPKRIVEKALRDWNIMAWRLRDHSLEIEEINARLTKTTSTLSAMPKSHGNNDSLVEGISRKMMIEEGEKEAVEYFKEILPPWNKLSDEERDILSIQYILSEDRQGYKKIMSKYHVEKTIAFSRINRALTHLTKLMFY